MHIHNRRKTIMIQKQQQQQQQQQAPTLSIFRRTRRNRMMTSYCSIKNRMSSSLILLLLQLLLLLCHVLHVPVVNGFATYLLSRSGCMTDLDTTEVIMNFNVIQQQQQPLEELEGDDGDDDDRMQLVLHQPNEKVKLVDSTIWIDPEKTASFPLTIHLQLLPYGSSKKNNKKKKKNEKGDYQFVLETALLDENGHVQEAAVDNSYSFFPKGSCEKHKRIAGRQADIISLVISKQPPPGTGGGTGGGGVAVWAGWAAGHEAVTVSTPVYIRLETAQAKAAAAAKAKAAAAAKEAAAATAAANKEESPSLKSVNNSMTAEAAAAEVPSLSSSSWSDFIMSDIGCASITMSQDDPVVIQERRVLQTWVDVESQSTSTTTDAALVLPPTMHLKVMATTETTTANGNSTIFEFDIMVKTNTTTKQADELAASAMFPRIIVLDVVAAGHHATWQSSSSSSNAHHNNITTTSTVSCGGRRIRIVQEEQGSASSWWPVVRLTLTMPTATKNDNGQEDEHANEEDLLQHGIFIRGVYSIAGHNETLYRTTTLDLSWKPDTKTPPPIRATTKNNHNNSITTTTAEPNKPETTIAYKELLKQQHATAHHEPRGQAGTGAAAKIHHAPNQPQHHDVDSTDAAQGKDHVVKGQHDRIEVKHKKNTDLQDSQQQQQQEAKKDQDEEEQRQQHLLALQDSNAPPRVLEEPSLVRTIPDRTNHHHQQQQQHDQHDGGQGSLRRRINNIFNKGSSSGNSSVSATNHHHRRIAAGAADDPVEAFVHGKEAYFWGMAVWIVGMIFTIQGCRALASRRHGGKGRRDL